MSIFDRAKGMVRGLLGQGKDVAGSVAGKGKDVAGGVAGKGMDVAGGVIGTVKDKVGGGRGDPPGAETASDAGADTVLERPVTSEADTPGDTDAGPSDDVVTPADVAEAVNDPNLPHPEPPQPEQSE